ncbi:hypothetical protein PNQ29_12835 [Halobacterium salinarum]|uniref:hypothetical protein n=1 Tax=Halobacterium salinarum TaxID=2242 RepID=UPI00255671DA|nr:hypothetical protein [Halobacterium salinarum]MDL0120607.1 hypothetical protein [Halobacterium salinarum]
MTQLESEYGFSDRMLESRLIDVVEEETGIQLEHVKTIATGEFPMHVFRVQTVEFEEVRPVVQTLAEILAAWMGAGDVEYSLVKR